VEEKKMISARQLLHDHGFRATPQRVSIYEVFGENEHLPAEDVFLRVRKKLPSISLATVYAIVKKFETSHLIREIRIDPGRVFYEKNTGVHYHFLCRQCCTVYDVHLLHDRMGKMKSVDGHTVDDFQGYFYGVCKRCV
jgi:Fur family transcriptional regulator, peroxide stress response regulator